MIYNQSLGTWSSLLDGWHLNLKLTLQDSSTVYPNRPEETLPVTYRPDFAFYSTLTYQGDKWYLQFQ